MGGGVESVRRPHLLVTPDIDGRPAPYKDFSWVHFFLCDFWGYPGPRSCLLGSPRGNTFSRSGAQFSNFLSENLIAEGGGRTLNLLVGKPMA